MQSWLSDNQTINQSVSQCHEYIERDRHDNSKGNKLLQLNDFFLRYFHFFIAVPIKYLLVLHDVG